MLLAPQLSSGRARPIHTGRRVRPAPTHGLPGTGEGWRGSGRPLCRQLAPAGKGINITKSRSKRRAVGRGLCEAPRAGGARGRLLSGTHPGSRPREAQTVGAGVCP